MKKKLPSKGKKQLHRPRLKPRKLLKLPQLLVSNKRMKPHKPKHKLKQMLSNELKLWLTECETLPLQIITCHLLEVVEQQAREVVQIYLVYPTFTNPHRQV